MKSNTEEATTMLRALRTDSYRVLSAEAHREYGKTKFIVQISVGERRMLLTTSVSNRAVDNNAFDLQGFLKSKVDAAVKSVTRRD